MNAFMIFYLFTGWIMSFDYIYHEKQKGKQLGLFDTGIMMFLFIIFWMPASLVAIYWYALIALYNIITEEEND